MYWKRALTVYRPEVAALNKRHPKISSKEREFLQRQRPLHSVRMTEKLGAGKDAKSRFRTGYGGKTWWWGGILEEGLGWENAKDTHAHTWLRAKLTPAPWPDLSDRNGTEMDLTKAEALDKGVTWLLSLQKKKKKSQERRHIKVSALAKFQLN